MISFTLIVGEEKIEETATKLDVFAFEDDTRRSWISSYDANDFPLVQDLYRIAWIVLKRRHGETRDFETWIEEDNPVFMLGIEEHMDPTGETPTPPDVLSPVSPVEEE